MFPRVASQLLIRKLGDDFRRALDLGGVKWLNGWKDIELPTGGLVDQIEGPTGAKVIANHFRITVPVRTKLCRQAGNLVVADLGEDVDMDGARNTPWRNEASEPPIRKGTWTASKAAATRLI
jgi:hypothetical protein